MSTCIITGASDGIGRATSIKLSKMGEYKNLVLIGCSLSKLKETEKLIDAELNIRIIDFDLSNLDEIPSLVENI